MSQEGTGREGTPPHCPAGFGDPRPAPLTANFFRGAPGRTPYPHAVSPSHTPPLPCRSSLPAHRRSGPEQGGAGRAGAASPERGLLGRGPCTAVCGDRPRRGRHALCAGGCEEHLNWRAGGAGSGCYYCRERERARASRRAGSRRAGGEPQRPGPPRSGKRGPRLRDPGRPRTLASGRAHAAPRTDVRGKSRPGRGHPARATRGPERSSAPTMRGHPEGLGRGADGCRVANLGRSDFFWARRSQPDKLSAGRSPRWEQWASEIHLLPDHRWRPRGSVLNYAGNPSPLPCFSSRVARDARGEKAREAAAHLRGHPGLAGHGRRRCGGG